MATSERKRGRTWEKEETIALLEKWGEENVQERLKECKRKKPIWMEISNYIKASGYEDREHEACKTRIHTLVSSYRAYKDQEGKTGTATPKKPPYYEELDNILSDKPATRPVLVLNSAKLQQKAEEDDEDDENGLSESVVENEDEYPKLKKISKRANETPSDEKKKKKRKTSTQEVMMTIDESISRFIDYQQNADREFLEMETERERKENEREEKRRKEDQEFFLKLARVLNN